MSSSKFWHSKFSPGGFSAQSLAQPLALIAVLLMESAPAFASQTKKVDVYYQSFHEFYSCSVRAS